MMTMQRFAHYRPPRSGRRRDKKQFPCEAELDLRSIQEITTPLHEACRLVDCQRITKLLHEGANVHAKDMYGDTPLHTICGHVIGAISLQAVQNLVEYGASPNARNVTSGSTPLHYASMCGHAKVVQYFLEECGADIYSRDNTGKTPLHIACIMQNNQLVIQCLLRIKGALANVRDYKGWTPLHYACWYGRTSHVETMLASKQISPSALYARGNVVPCPSSNYKNDTHLSTFPFVGGMDYCPTPLDLAHMKEHKQVMEAFERYEASSLGEQNRRLNKSCH